MTLVTHRRATPSADRGQTRLVVAVALALGLVLLLSVVTWAVRGRAAQPSEPAVASQAPSPAAPAGLAVLRAWDAQRAEAWARGDPRRLRDLYTPGSATGASDVAMLRAWTDRGLVVTGLRQQVLAIRVLARTDDRLRVRVTDRLAAATAVGDDVRRALPATLAAQRVVDLRRAGGRWRVAEVRVT